jgi:hypothetical protein
MVAENEMARPASGQDGPSSLKALQHTIYYLTTQRVNSHTL